MLAHATHGSTAVITLYGIKNCDTVKKARKWLDSHGIEYRFHDFRDDGLDQDAVATWIKELGWQNLVNRNSPSWRSLDEQVRQELPSRFTDARVIERPRERFRQVADAVLLV